MRKFLLTACLLACVLAAACTLPAPGPGAPAGDGASRGPLTLLISGDATDQAAYRQLIAAFHAGHPEIDVELISIPSGGDFRKRLAADFAAGTPPDLFLINYRNLGRFLASGAVEPLTTYIAGSREIDPQDYYPQALAAFQWQGGQACLPQNISSPVIYYNKDLFDAAGVAYPPADWDWEAFVATARQLTQDRDGDGVTDTYGFGVEPTIVRAAPFVWMNGGDLVDDPAAPRGAALDAPAAREALEWFIELQTVHGVVPAAAAEEAESSLSRFVNGRTAMYMDSRRAVPEFRLIESFDWDVAPLPQGATRASILHSDAFCMAAGSKHKEAAWALLEFGGSAAGQALLAQTGRTVPSRPDVAESAIFLDAQAKPANSRVFLEAIPYIRSLPIMAAWSDIEGILNIELQNAFYGRSSLEGALAAIDARSAEFFGPAPTPIPIPTLEPQPTPTPTLGVGRADLPRYLAILQDVSQPRAQRALAARAIGQVMVDSGPDRAAVAALVAVLGEEHNAPEWYIYSDVAAALGTAGPAAKAAVPGLIPLLGAKYGAAIQAAAHDALKAITGEDYGTDIERWERWWVDHQ